MALGFLRISFQLRNSFFAAANLIFLFFSEAFVGLGATLVVSVNNNTSQAIKLRIFKSEQQPKQ